MSHSMESGADCINGTILTKKQSDTETRKKKPHENDPKTKECNTSYSPLKRDYINAQLKVKRVLSSTRTIHPKTDESTSKPGDYR